MQKIPFFHSYDTQSKTLTLRNASYFPEEVFEFANQIEILDAAQGTLKELPSRFAELSRLRVLFLSQNLFTKIPDVLVACSNLEIIGFKSCQISVFDENVLPINLKWLILTDNQLRQLPRSIGDLASLRKFALTGNYLESLPEEMIACQNLELLRLSANSLPAEPANWIFNLPKLSWYADSGNPFQKPFIKLVELPKIRYDQIQLIKLLGESPSSEVWEASAKGFAEGIAVKKYKGRLTSDGYIIDDLEACIAVGQHPNIIPVIGQIDHQANENQGLLLKLISSEYQSLGCPPNFKTCTRDTFPVGTSFSLEFILEILKNIASAMSHLHQRGITHGDLYAHNILANHQGDCVLGDFGAASRYDPTSHQREFLDIRAFGCLMEDLINHSVAEIPLGLKVLRDYCLTPIIIERPLMAEVKSLLTHI